MSRFGLLFFGIERLVWMCFGSGFVRVLFGLCSKILRTGLKKVRI